MQSVPSYPTTKCGYKSHFVPGISFACLGYSSNKLKSGSLGGCGCVAETSSLPLYNILSLRQSYLPVHASVARSAKKRRLECHKNILFTVKSVVGCGVTLPQDDNDICQSFRQTARTLNDPRLPLLRMRWSTLITTYSFNNSEAKDTDNHFHSVSKRINSVSSK